MKLKSIGIIHTPFKKLEGMPVQPHGAIGVKGKIDIFDEFRDGLKDLDGFSHIILIYMFHRSRGFKLEVVPFLDTLPRGLFSTRAPKRPNPIGISTVKLDRIEEGKLYVQNIDILDGTPLLDIKPYIPEIDGNSEIRIGWFEQGWKTVSRLKSDKRFK